MLACAKTSGAKGTVRTEDGLFLRGLQYLVAQFCNRPGWPDYDMTPERFQEREEFGVPVDLVRSGRARKVEEGRRTRYWIESEETV